MLLSSKIRFLATLGHRSITSASIYHHGAISEGDRHTNLSRKRSRGGQNLSDRYIRLEKSIRGKAALSKELEEFAESDSSAPASTQALLKSTAKPIRLFHGFQVPEEPKPPADDECCMSGCAVCVYDLYEESLEAYNKAVAALRTSLSALHIPESEWPANIRPKETNSNDRERKRKATILSAFEEMERKLALRKQADADAESGASNSVDPMHWKKRQQLAASKKTDSRDNVHGELYEGIRWVLFSSR
ncbi:oxidoreductase-like protein [Flammula alnicola]|nr:oxidoreductase-like protein [Flammula alnicola]